MYVATQKCSTCDKGQMPHFEMQRFRCVVIAPHNSCSVGLEGRTFLYFVPYAMILVRRLVLDYQVIFFDVASNVCVIAVSGTGTGYSVLDMVAAMKTASGRDVRQSTCSRLLGDWSGVSCAISYLCF